MSYNEWKHRIWLLVKLTNYQRALVVPIGFFPGLITVQCTQSKKNLYHGSFWWLLKILRLSFFLRLITNIIYVWTAFVWVLKINSKCSKIEQEICNYHQVIASLEITMLPLKNGEMVDHVTMFLSVVLYRRLKILDNFQNSFYFLELKTTFSFSHPKKIKTLSIFWSFGKKLSEIRDLRKNNWYESKVENKSILFFSFYT